MKTPGDLVTGNDRSGVWRNVGDRALEDFIGTVHQDDVLLVIGTTNRKFGNDPISVALLVLTKVGIGWVWASNTKRVQT